MTDRILIYNPSDSPRGGWVTLPWAPITGATGLDPDGLTLTQGGNQVPFYQVDQLDPADPSRDTLSFFLNSPVEPGDEHYSKPTAEVLVGGRPAGDRPRRPPPEQVSDFEVSNLKLDVRFNLSPESEDNKGRWYAGSARSVRLERLREEGDRREYLDYFNRMFHLNHDPEKRCMQLTSVQLWHPDLDAGHSEPVYLFNRPYRLVSLCNGPVRKCVTIASSPFDSPRAGDEAPRRCELYRVFSLYEDREYVLEEIFLKPEGPPGGEGPAPYFKARYFTYMNLSEPALRWYENVPDWFALGDLQSSLLYGFACDVHVGSISYPEPDYPDPDKIENTFSWNLDPCRAATCLHLFTKFPFNQPPAGLNAFDSMERFNRWKIEWFQEQAGQAWYKFIYKPLRARLAGAGEDLSNGGPYYAF
jgi:hypothetical protein